MRMYLLLILFFANTILARSARTKRDVITIQPSNNFTTEASTEKTTTDVTEDKCDGINCENNSFSQSLRTMFKLIKSLLTSISNTLATFLKSLNSTGDLMLRAMMQPLVAMLNIMIKTMKWMLQFL